jgi:Cadherin-like
MSTWNILRWLRPGNTRVPYRRRPRTRSALCLRLEHLEDRLTPSTVTVTSGADSGAGSLRALLASATSGEVIDFAPSVRTINLTSTNGYLIITTNVTIENDQGTGPVTINGGGVTSDFAVEDRATASISGLVISHGNISATGGGITILQDCTLTVSDCTFLDDSANDGGGIEDEGTLTVNDCTFTGCDGAVAGGGIQNSGGTMTVNDCTFSGNTTSNIGAGGGLENGGLETSEGLYQGTTTINDCTFSGNSASVGGGIFGGSNGTMTLNGNVIVGNTLLSGAPDDLDNAFGILSASSSDNVVGTDDKSSLPVGQGNQINVTVAQAGLAPLGNYGGPTQTFALLPGSFAVGKGQPAPETGVLVDDQRGAPRPTSGQSDAGAFQDEGYSLTASNTPQSAPVNTAFAQPLVVTLTEGFANAPVPGATIDYVAPGSGPSATLTSPAVTNANGQTSVTATANNTVGSYDVTASDGTGLMATFDLTNTSNGAAPTVIDPTDASVTQTSATLGGDVTNGGSAPVTARGVVYSLTSLNGDPLLGGIGVTNLTSVGTTGVFTINASGLTPDTMYSFAAYATNSVGTTYSTPATTFMTPAAPVVPTVIDPTDTSITASSATLGGDVTNDGGATITARGVVYSLTSVNSNPRLGGTGVTEVSTSGTTGVFTIDAVGLMHGATYSFAAFATNSVGTAYTSPVSFTTETVPSVTVDLGYTVALEDVALGNEPLPIDPSQLMTTETGFSAAQLTYAVKSMPQYGVFAKSGVALAVGSTFTQDDINNGRVTFQNTDVADAAPTGVTTSFAFTVTDPNGNSTSQQSFVINFGRVKAVSSVTDGSGHLSNYIQFENGIVYRTPPFSLPLQQVVSTPTSAISAGTDNGKNADVTVEYANNDALWTYTNSGKTQLVFAQESAAGHTPLSIVAGLNGVVDVVFSDHQLWQANLASPTSPTLITANVKFVTIGVHGAGASAVEADYIAFLDSGTTNGGVWEHYVLPGSGAHWVNVTSLDVYAISASQDLSDTADLIVSNRNNSGIVDHQVYGWRGTVGSLTEVTGVAVSSVAMDAAGNDYYVMQSAGGMYEHKAGVPLSTPATPIVTPHPTGVATVGVANGQTNVADILFANGTYWQVSGLSNGTDVFKQVAT